VAAQERGRIQGFLASVWAISAVVGPLAGGFIVAHASWSWIAPMPWINRKAIIAGIDQARPHRKDAARKTAMPMSRAMVAIEATIVSTAMPGIVGELGGLSIYAWVFSGFLLTQTAATIARGRRVVRGVVMGLFSTGRLWAWRRRQGRGPRGRNRPGDVSRRRIKYTTALPVTYAE
jgi:MFS family permease